MLARLVRSPCDHKRFPKFRKAIRVKLIAIAGGHPIQRLNHRRRITHLEQAPPPASLTCLECLYHLPCQPSAQKLDGFGNGWLAPETAMRTNRVVVDPPAFRQDLRFFERVEQLAVQKLLPHLCSVMPSFRQASSTARSLPVSSSIVRKCCRISSGVTVSWAW